MAFNETLTYGNITTPVVDTFLKVDYALGGGFTLFIHLVVFLMILTGYYKRYGEFLRGLIVAGFITSFSSAMLTVFGYLPWQYIYMSISLFAMGLIAWSMEKRG